MTYLLIWKYFRTINNSNMFVDIDWICIILVQLIILIIIIFIELLLFLLVNAGNKETVILTLVFSRSWNLFISIILISYYRSILSYLICLLKKKMYFLIFEGQIPLISVTLFLLKHGKTHYNRKLFSALNTIHVHVDLYRIEKKWLKI